MEQEKYMARALELAKKGMGYVSPNPMVGAVIVKDGKIIGEGYHKKCGDFHAERNAFANCTQDPKGAEIYVTLEPCCHHGKTPPCTEIIIEKGIKKVYVGSLDPNPLVAGKSIPLLEEKGIYVETGILQKECDDLNEVFFHFITNKRPYVVMKYAMTADGKIATKTGASRWISGEESRAEVQQLRHRYRGILIGVETVRKDDPLLTCHMEGGKNPLRIICDSALRIPLDSRIMKTAKEVPTLIVGILGAKENQKALIDLGAEVLLTPPKNGRVDLSYLMEKLGEKNIDSVLLEGGSAIQFSALQEGIVQEVLVYQSPKIFGGATAKSPVGGEGVATVGEAFLLDLKEVKVIGKDVCTRYQVRRE